MRVSTSMIFNSGVRGILDLQSALYQTQNQLSTGRRILTPADDPIGASEVLKVSQSKEVNKQFLANQATAKAQLGFVEVAIAGVGDELMLIHEKAVQAGNATYSPEQRGMIAAELKQRLESLVGLANTQDGTGLYIFSGYQANTKPFEQNIGAVPPYSLGTDTHFSYNGDAGRPALQVSSSRVMDVAENGIDVFMKVKDANGVVTGRSMFDSVKNLVDILDGTRPYASVDFDQALGDLVASIDHVATVRASIGARLQGLDGLSSVAEDANYIYDVRLSELQDLDYNEAISRFVRYQTQLEATQLTFKQTSQLSLFNIL